MPCTSHPLSGGQRAIVCTPNRRCKCGRRATLLCDWKVPTKKSGTCDRPLCDRCTTKPTADKDLCAEHAVAFREWATSR